MDTVQKRRSRLRGWIDLKCEGSQARFVEVTGINQGELSGLLKTKSFGEKKARTLEIHAGMPPMYLDAVDDDSNVSALVNNVSPGPEIRGMLPLISWVKVGEFCDVIDNFEPGDAAAWYPCPVAHGPNAYVLRVAGDSMSPEYRDGEMIFIDQRGQYENGDDVIVRTPEFQATFKRLQITPEGTYLLALNPSWPDRVIKIPADSQIYGKVIFSGRPR
jgi:SOS-response transcriptional repressor LexA